MENSKILLIEKILYLGKKLEKGKIFELMGTWKFKASNPAEVQKAGKRISEFLGLSNLTFIVTYSKQDVNTAGHIELNNNSSEGVYIEIDGKFKSDSEPVLAILAHEICHKYLHINGLTLSGYENEILTDVATVYTGLGKLSLNGCEGDLGWTVMKRNVPHYKVGYLDREQFAFLYKVICNMRRIPDDVATSTLNVHAVKALNDMTSYFNNDFFYNESMLQRVEETLSNESHKLHFDLALNINLYKTFQSAMEHIDESNKEIHKKIKQTRAKYLRKANEKTEPESLKYLKNFILFNDLQKLKGMYKDEEERLDIFNNQYITALTSLSEFFQIDDFNNRDKLYNIECPTCGYHMKLKLDKRVKIKCKECKYSFIVDNRKIELWKQAGGWIQKGDTDLKIIDDGTNDKENTGEVKNNAFD